MADLSGQTIGQYQIKDQIGEGGMATVYKAYQPSLDRLVAFKILPQQYAYDKTFLTRFQREARAIAKLSHANILPIYDFGQEGNTTYIVMQYIDGGTLKDIMGQSIALSQIVHFIDQIAAALDHAHQRGILHRDIKPTNILLEEGKRALLTDFGLAKMMEGDTQLTGAGVGIGTPAYMSPEQGQGLNVDIRTDIYALGIILYEMATGQVPYQANTPMAIVVKHVMEPLPPPRAITPKLPIDIEQVILKALDKNKAERYASAGQMAKALRQAVTTAETGSMVLPDQPTQGLHSTPAPTAGRQPPSTLSPPAPPAPTIQQVQPAAYPPTNRPMAAPIAVPRQNNALPFLIIGGGMILLFLLVAGLAGFFFINRNNVATPAIEFLPTPTLTPILSPTPNPTNTPKASGPAQFGNITFAMDYNKSKLEPINPATSFTEGLVKIHAIFEFSGMSNDTTWERVWYLDGEELFRTSTKWTGDESGVFDYFIDAEGDPLSSGKWRLELYVEKKLLRQGNFTIE